MELFKTKEARSQSATIRKPCTQPRVSSNFRPRTVRCRADEAAKSCAFDTEQVGVPTYTFHFIYLQPPEQEKVVHIHPNPDKRQRAIQQQIRVQA